MNLQASSRGYLYRSATMGPAIEVKVYYTLGGVNYFSGGRNRRGIYVSFTPCDIKDRGSIAYVMGSGRGVLVHELARKSDKALAAVAGQLDAHIPALVQTFVDEQHSGEAVIAEVRRLLGALQENPA